MSQSFILEYWNDDGWLVGRLKGIPGVFSQGQTLEELEQKKRVRGCITMTEFDGRF